MRSSSVVQKVHDRVDDGRRDWAAALGALHRHIRYERIFRQQLFRVGGTDEADGDADNDRRKDIFFLGESKHFKERRRRVADSDDGAVQFLPESAHRRHRARDAFALRNVCNLRICYTALDFPRRTARMLFC